MSTFRIGLTLLFLSGLGVGAARAAEGHPREQPAVTALRSVATNIQFHRDGSVRLVRLSKPAVTDGDLALAA